VQLVETVHRVIDVGARGKVAELSAGALKDTPSGIAIFDYTIGRLRILSF
jgi:hypothetical protein